MAVLQDPNRPTAVNPAHVSRLNLLRTNSKDLCKDPERTEGYDRAYNQTFGAGKFTISVKGSDSFDFDMDDGFSFGGGYGGISAAEHELEEIKEFQEYTYLMDLASGGDGNPWNDAYETNTLSFDDPDYFYTPAQYSYGGYSLDTSDPFTRDRVMNSKLVTDPLTGASYFDDGFSCSKPDGAIAALYTAAKRDLEGSPLDLTNKATLQMVQSAKVDPDTGSVITDTMCASPEYGQKIIEAKAQLDGTGPSSSAIASVTKSQPGGHDDVMSQILPLSSQAQIEVPGMSAQGNDLFIATRGLESRGIIVAKPSTDASPVATAPTSPSITDGIAMSQKSAPEFKAPAASPAQAPAPIV